MLPLWYFVDQSRILSKGIKILILSGLNNFHIWFIQEPRRRVSFALFFFLCARWTCSKCNWIKWKKKPCRFVVCQVKRDHRVPVCSWSVTFFLQNLISLKYYQWFFENLEEASLTNSSSSKVSLHVSKLHYQATIGLFCFSHARKPRNKTSACCFRKHKKQFYTCLYNEDLVKSYRKKHWLKGKLHCQY